VGTGVLVALLLAFMLEAFFGGLSGKTEEIFEGVLMFITAGFLTWMILWVHRQKDVAKKIKERVASHAKEGYGAGIFILIVTSVFREGTETVLYLKASSIVGQSNQLIGAILGIGVALALGYALFRSALRVNLSLVFHITSIFLLLFAAGLVSHGIHEFQEVGILPVFSFDPIFNLAHILDHKSVAGSFLRVLFGYTSRPTLLEIVSYISYIGFIIWLERFTDRFVQAKVRRIMP
ncbi:FTR1 family protein, partial [Candidatus Roizmanbacteria bacterium]|nr:FTR1 family protein [Candidatus Roizmanbacteria bacterium]